MFGNHKNITPITVKWNFFPGKSRVPRPCQYLLPGISALPLPVPVVGQDEIAGTTPLVVPGVGPGIVVGEQAQNGTSYVRTICEAMADSNVRKGWCNTSNHKICA